MAFSARAHLGWSEQRATMVQDAVNRALAHTAKCRQVIPKEPDQIGNRAVVWPTVSVPLSLGPDVVASPIHIHADFSVDDWRIDDEAAFIHLVRAGAAQLGSLEDGEIIMGAMAGAPPAGAGRTQRNNFAPLARAQLNSIVAAPAGTGSTEINAGGGPPTGAQLVNAVVAGMISLEQANRPGRCGLLLHNSLLGTLGLPAAPGAAPFIHQVEQIIGGNEITGTPALSGMFHALGETGAILFRLDPPAVAIVQTMLPTLTFLSRNAGQTSFRIEEEIVVQIFDQRAVHHIRY